MQRIAQAMFKPPQYPPGLDEPLVIHHRPQPFKASGILVFIHGLGGTRYGTNSTWGNFPEYVFDDFPRLDVGLYAYRTGLKRLHFLRSIDLEREAEVLASLLRTLDEYKRIILIGHSMGGLLARGAIAHLVSTNQRRLLRRIDGLVLMASPQLGSLRALGVFTWLSKDGRALRAHNEYLRRINQTFLDYLTVDARRRQRGPKDLPTFAVIASADLWVDALSAGYGLPTEQIATVAGTHTDLVKPQNKTSDCYVHVRHALQVSMESAQSAAGSAEGWERQECDVARGGDLQDVHSMARREFGDDVSSLRQMQEWQSKRNEVIWVIRRLSRAAGQRVARTVGYFCLLPLHATAVEAIRNGTLTGAAIEAEHICRSGEAPSAIYVGGLLGVDRAARASVMDYVRLRLGSTGGPYVGTPLLTRPVTSDGLRVARSYDMEPVPGMPDELGSLFNTPASA